VIIDGHNDTLKQAFVTGRSLMTCGTAGHIDLPRARLGGLKAGIFAIQVPPETAEERAFGYGLTQIDGTWEVAYARAIGQRFASDFADGVLRWFAQAAAEAGGTMEMVTTCEALEAALARDVLAVMLHLEGAEAIREDLTNLDDYYAAGVRSLGLVWSRPNAFGYGVPFRFPSHPDTGPGLTDAGRRLVRRCNERGILVDLAHITERGFWDVVELSTAPIVVSHANAHAICRTTTNLLDTQLDAVGGSDGLVGVLFDVLNTRPDGQLVRDTPLDAIVRHVDHIASRIGPAHVAFGSDFDGGQMPAALDGADKLPRLLECLDKRGYGADDLAGITHGNWLRVLRATWRTAADA
jgi:membrane dipeptidase